MGERMTLTDNEISHLLTSPDALRAVADYNDWNECMADSMGADASYNRQRREWFNAEAKRIEAEWDAERKAEQRVFLPAHLTQPAQAVDVGAIREVIAELRNTYTNICHSWADKLTAALPNANGKEG